MYIGPQKGYCKNNDYIPYIFLNQMVGKLVVLSVRFTSLSPTLLKGHMVFQSGIPRFWLGTPTAQQVRFVSLNPTLSPTIEADPVLGIKAASPTTVKETFNLIFYELATILTFTHPLHFREYRTIRITLYPVYHHHHA